MMYQNFIVAVYYNALKKHGIYTFHHLAEAIDTAARSVAKAPIVVIDRRDGKIIWENGGAL